MVFHCPCYRPNYCLSCWALDELLLGFSFLAKCPSELVCVLSLFAYLFGSICLAMAFKSRPLESPTLKFNSRHGHGVAVFLKDSNTFFLGGGGEGECGWQHGKNEKYER